MSFNFNDLDFSCWIPKDFSFIKNTLSLSPFLSVMEGVLVCGCYAVAAVILPWILDLILVPFGFSLILMGGVAMAFGLYLYMNQIENNIELWNSQTRSGGVMIGLGTLLSFASCLAPFFVLGIGLYRIYISLSPAQIDEASLHAQNIANNLTTACL
ncbi:MAG: hypothetical protein EBQ95_04640 [Gammaproteobacteria bacterium]|nr:hypothetical protein [Gammaproteobacteria bacterium]